MRAFSTQQTLPRAKYQTCQQLLSWKAGVYRSLSGHTLPCPTLWPSGILPLDGQFCCVHRSPGTAYGSVPGAPCTALSRPGQGCLVSILHGMLCGPQLCRAVALGVCPIWFSPFSVSLPQLPSSISCYHHFSNQLLSACPHHRTDLEGTLTQDRTTF